jgi:hypothetical protein
VIRAPRSVKGTGEETDAGVTCGRRPLLPRTRDQGRPEGFEGRPATGANRKTLRGALDPFRRSATV